jgi:signal transduction histidine kinase
MADQAPHQAVEQLRQELHDLVEELREELQAVRAVCEGLEQQQAQLAAVTALWIGVGGRRLTRFPFLAALADLPDELAVHRGQ